MEDIIKEMLACGYSIEQLKERFNKALAHEAAEKARAEEKAKADEALFDAMYDATKDYFVNHYNMEAKDFLSKKEIKEIIENTDLFVHSFIH